MIPPKFRMPPDMARHLVPIFGAFCKECGAPVAGSAEYDMLGEFIEPPVVIDIGANVGAFCVWAESRWPGCEVFAYEPNPKALALLEKNVACMQKRPQIAPLAVTMERTGKVALYQGLHNLGMASLIPEIAGTNDAIQVDTVPVEDLPQCDVLKLDCEGNEPELFARYVASHEPPMLIACEYHSPHDMMEFQRYAGKQYRIVSVKEHVPSRGVVCMRKE